MATERKRQECNGQTAQPSRVVALTESIECPQSCPNSSFLPKGILVEAEPIHHDRRSVQRAVSKGMKESQYEKDQFKNPRKEI